ncbi:hypothetical protein EE612_004038 [Oryza sativa]|nr:hypothetical protein EE612_004038 [Oryza sativa]
MSSKFLAIYLLLAFLSHGTCSYMATTASGWDDHDFFRHCPPSRCSKDGPEIRFPHRLESSNTSSACGASCARLACSGQDTILHHPILGPCKVTSIDYKEAVINIIHLLPFPCPLQKLMVDSLPPDDYHGCELYSNDPAKIVQCSKKFTPSGTSPVDGEAFMTTADYITGPISCLGDTKHFSYLVFARLYMYVLPLDCRIVSKGSIPIPRPLNIYGPTFKERAEAIINLAEITVSWFNCTKCERQKQRCAFSSQRNQTFCMSHKHHGTIANCSKSNIIVPHYFYFLNYFSIFELAPSHNTRI